MKLMITTYQNAAGFVALVLALLAVDPVSGQGREDAITRSRQNAITDAIQRVSPAVAGINVVKLQKSRSNFINDPYWRLILPDTYRRVHSLGSGMVISSDGYVVTNAHVVEDAAEVIVTLPGGHEYPVTAILTDDITDIALLKIDAASLPYARMGDSDDLIIGEWAIALGNPLGLFDVSKQPTATVGIISALHMDFGQKETRVYQDMIQTDAAINQGNSGGPLVNSHGEAIGINSFIYTERGSSGLGFSIPINRVKEVVRELKTRGFVDRSFTTGLELTPINASLMSYLNLPSARGAVVIKVPPGSAGDRAGLQIRDVILEANDKPVNNARDIMQVITEGLLRAGDIIKLKVWRDGAIYEVDLELGEGKNGSRTGERE